MKLAKLSYYLFASVILMFAYQNCSRPHFSVDSALKAQVEETPVFGRDPGEDPSGGGRDPGDDPTGGGRDPGVDPNNTTVTFTYVCSDRGTGNANTNVLSAEALKLVVENAQGNVVCEMQGDYRTDVLNKKSLTLKQVCGTLPSGQYRAYLVDTKRSDYVAANLIYAQNNVSDPIPLKFSVDSNGSIALGDKSQEQSKYKKSKSSKYSTPKYALLYDANTKGVNQGLAFDPEDPCDDRQSPLIVHLGAKVAKGIELSAPLDGVQFDILGERSFPVAHTKKQISWFKNEEHEYYFIVKPNRNGEVLGINEMFGNNTRGPDGRYAKHGYAALAKYDIDGDGYISNHDPVYSELRLWRDGNLDGIAQASELYGLDEKQIELIDLHFSNRFKETDAYGNKTLMKSVVKTTDGELHLMFDLWFRYLNISN